MVSPELLRRYTFFGFLNDRQLKAIAMLSEEGVYEAGQRVTTEGQPAECLFLLMNGSIDLYFRAEVKDPAGHLKEYPAGEVNPGEPFGLTSMIEPFIYTTTMRASKPSGVIKIDAPALRDLCAQDESLAYHLMRQIASIALQRLNATRVQLASAWA